jgi:hypothetical protein
MASALNKPKGRMRLALIAAGDLPFFFGSGAGFVFVLLPWQIHILILASLAKK